MGNVRGGIGWGAARRREEKCRGQGRWRRRQTGESIWYKMVLAAGVDNG